MTKVVILSRVVQGGVPGVVYPECSTVGATRARYHPREAQISQHARYPAPPAAVSILLSSQPAGENAGTLAAAGGTSLVIG